MGIILFHGGMSVTSLRKHSSRSQRVPLQERGYPFQKSVWRSLKNIFVFFEKKDTHSSLEFLEENIHTPVTNQILKPVVLV